MTGVIYSGREGWSLGSASMIFWSWCMLDHRVKWPCCIGTRVYAGWPLDIVRSDDGDWSLTKDACKRVWAASGELLWVQTVQWNLTLSVHEWDSCEYVRVCSILIPHLLSWGPISQAELILSGWSPCLIPIPMTSGSFRDVPLSSYIVHLTQLALLSLISEDNHCLSVLACSYPISFPYSEYLWLKEWHCHSITLTEYQGRLLCAWMAAEVCCNVWVVMHDPQGGSLCGLPLGLSKMFWGISVVGFRWSAWGYLGGCNYSGLILELVDQVLTIWTH